MRLSLTPTCGVWRRCDAPALSSGASADCWLIPENFEVRATAYDAGTGNLTRIRLLSGCDLDQQVKSDGATWLDRRLVGRDKSPLATSGFGVEVCEALDRRGTFSGPIFPIFFSAPYSAS